MIDVALATARHLPEGDPDDVPLFAAIEAEGLTSRLVAWDDPEFDWSEARVCLIRSTWDYHRRRAEFLAWTKRTASKTRLVNAPDAVEWNSHKSYLRELEARGVTIVPTAWFARGERAKLARVMEEREWDEAIVKPVVSAGAERTLHVHAGNREEGERQFQELLAAGETMVQPYMAEVEASGERSMIFIGGELTHSVRKRPILKRSGDDWLEADPAEFTKEEAEFARRALAASGFETLYARVDLVRDREGALHLMELEMVEPTLFFLPGPEAARMLARELAKLCRKGKTSPERT
jgi:glutathione synthase/RimK-type ligase-like ATP-grasp enzyme